MLPAAAVLLGLAVLAKSLPALALAAPLGLRWRWFRDLLRVRVVGPFLLVAVPWHVLCYWRNGHDLYRTLFWQHQFGRFVSGELMHVQPWWFYLPRLPALLLPWAPLLLLLLVRREGYGDPRRLFLLLWLVLGVLLFSISKNKLPGYVLPLLPAVAALMGLGLEEARRAGAVLVCCALLLAAFRWRCRFCRQRWPKGSAMRRARCSIGCGWRRWPWRPGCGCSSGAGDGWRRC